MELRHLRYFIAVAEELSFTKAADKLCIVQPSLTKQIQNLEMELGVQLFLRNKRKVELTPAGSRFLICAMDILRSTNIAIDSVRKEN